MAYSMTPALHTSACLLLYPVPHGLRSTSGAARQPQHITRSMCGWAQPARGAGYRHAGVRLPVSRREALVLHQTQHVTRPCS